MNSTLDLLLQRRTHRSFKDEPIKEEDLKILKEATLRAPTAGNMMFYSVLEITDQDKRDKLAILCDNQSFIATAPLVWVFVSDVQKWVNYYRESGSVAKGSEMGIEERKIGLGDLFLANSDALIAAQTAVIAAEALQIGSCYIGDVLEEYEKIKKLLDLPKHAVVTTLLVFGYPKNPNPLEQKSIRCPASSIFMENGYKEPHLKELQIAFGKQEEHLRKQKRLPFDNSGTISDFYYFRKHNSPFMEEMNRSVGQLVEKWLE